MKILISAIGIMVILVALAPSAFARMDAPLSKHPISDMVSGYNHGVADAKDPCKPDCRNVYIWQPGNGFINQTKEFIDGYVLGFCAIAGVNASMDEPEADFYCSDGPVSAGWMIGSTLTGTYTSKFTKSPPSYWTANNATVSKDFKKYHLFLDGVNLFLHNNHVFPSLPIRILVKGKM